MMQFGTFLDREGRFFDTTHFPASPNSSFRGCGLHLLRGKVDQNSACSLTVSGMQKLETKGRREEGGGVGQ